MHQLIRRGHGEDRNLVWGINYEACIAQGLLILLGLIQHSCLGSKQRWRSGESARLPPGVTCGLSLLLVLYSGMHGYFWTSSWTPGCSAGEQITLLYFTFCAYTAVSSGTVTEPNFWVWLLEFSVELALSSSGVSLPFMLSCSLWVIKRDLINQLASQLIT